MCTKPSFQEKLPANAYTIKVNTGKRLTLFLKEHGLYLSKGTEVMADTDQYITVWCGGIYCYKNGRSLRVDRAVLTAKEFKALVKSKVGE